jgi:tetratricopeptide (TPR) repeat protein
VFNSSGQAERARALFQEAWEAASGAEGEDYYAVDAAHMIAIVEPPEAQIEWNLRALDLAERSKEQKARRWLGSLYNNMGWTYHDRGEHERALELFLKAQRAREAQGDAEQVRVARWCVARAMRSLGRLDAALEIQRELERERAGAGTPDGYVHEEIAECLLALGNEVEARPYFARAYQELLKDRWLAENERARLERLRHLGA